MHIGVDTHKKTHVLIAASWGAPCASTLRRRSPLSPASPRWPWPRVSRHGHRVNFGGNRQLNRAIHIIALTQRRCEPQAQAYYAKKRAAGKTARAAMRCLKRRLVDVLYRLWYARPVASPQSAAASAA
jgi:hypothetical protein